MAGIMSGLKRRSTEAVSAPNLANPAQPGYWPFGGAAGAPPQGAAPGVLPPPGIPPMPMVPTASTPEAVARRWLFREHRLLRKDSRLTLLLLRRLGPGGLQRLLAARRLHLGRVVRRRWLRNNPSQHRHLGQGAGLRFNLHSRADNSSLLTGSNPLMGCHNNRRRRDSRLVAGLRLWGLQFPVVRRRKALAWLRPYRCRRRRHG